MHNYKIIENGEPIDRASKALIMLHGRGSNTSDILRLAKQFHTEGFYLAAPQAENNSWYPYSFMTDEKDNEPWLSSAIEIVHKLINEISSYIPKNKIYLMGFSQGACLALESTSKYADSYGGVVAFSGGLIGKSLKKDKYKGDFKGTQVFIGNSDIDPHIPLSRCKESKELMENLGAKVTLKVYKGMGHTINDDEINWVKENIFGEKV